MNVLRDTWMLGWVLVALAVAQLIPALAAPLWGEPVLPYAASAIAAGVFGIPIVLSVRPTDSRFRASDGFAVAVGAWLLATGFGALPYLATDALGPIDALFESAAGFTTTAASVIPSVEAQPRALLLWRAETQWLGGMGVLVLAVWLLPFLGIGGMQLFESDLSRSAGSSFSTTAKRLFTLYFALTALVFVALQLTGMSAFDAFCHALTSVSTGGFSTRDASAAGFESAAIEWVLIGAMFLGAMSFAIHYRIATGRIRGIAGDGELRYYATTLVLAALLLYASQTGTADAGGGRSAVFHAVSMMSGAGFHSEDFALWGGFAQLVLLGLIVVGGMSGSTTGGIKSLRLLVGARALRDTFTSLLHPHAVRRVKYAGHSVSDEVLGAIWAYFTAYFLLVGAVAVLMASADYDLVTCVSVAFSTTANVGPALGASGPGDGFAHMPAIVKLGVALGMIVGRLDVFTLLVVLRPRFWRG